MYKLAEKGDLDGVRSQVNRGVDVNKVDHYGNSALMSAGRWGREDVVLFLLKKGANINAQNNFGYTALMEAARFGQMAMVRLLVDHGAGIRGYIQNDKLNAIQLCPIKAMASFLTRAAEKEDEVVRVATEAAKESESIIEIATDVSRVSTTVK